MGGMAPPVPDRRLAAARWISRIGHPFVLIPVMVLAVTLQKASARTAVATAATVAAVTVLPVLVFLWRQVRGGRYADYDASVPQHRKHLYPVLLGIAVASTVVLWRLLPGMRAGLLGGLVMLVAAMLANRLLKVSLHSTYGAFCVVLLAQVSLAAGAVAAAVVALVAWSRLVLERHRPAEVATGLLLGAIGGGLVVWLG
jgi:hypothetical protein